MEIQQFRYDNKIVQKFLYATILWGVVGMSVGLLLAFMFLFPNVTEGISWLSFGRLRPLHTNAVIFAFVGNAIFAGVYYSLQRHIQRICRVGMANRFSHCSCLGSLWLEHDRYHFKKKAKALICGNMVLFGHLCYRSCVAHF